MQTAVEYLIEEIQKRIPPFYAQYVMNMDDVYEQAKEMEEKKEYETKAYWFGRGILAGRENKIKELQPKQ